MDPHLALAAHFRKDIMKPKQGLKKRRAKKLERSVVSYDSLEPRHLLATDVGLAFTGSTYVTDRSHYPPDANGDVGRDHMVEVLNGVCCRAKTADGLSSPACNI